MSADLLGIGASGLRAARAALEVAGDNVANASTPGYARRALVQRAGQAGAAMTALSRDPTGGVGVEVPGLRRIGDDFRANVARSASAAAARYAAGQAWLAPLLAALPSGDAGIGAAIGALFDAGSAVAADPNATAPRTAFLSAADTLATGFRTAAGKLAEQRAGLTSALDTACARVTAIGRELAGLNDRIRRASPGTADAATLADRQDRLLDELATFTPVRAVRTADGGTDVRLPGGAALVSGGGSSVIVARGAQIVADPYGAGTPQRIDSGELGGLTDAMRRTTDAAAALDRLASDIGSALNAAHGAGRDLDGAAGAALFSGTSLDIAGSRANSGETVVNATAASAATLAAGGYRLSFDAGTALWTLARADGTASVTAPSPLTLDGMTVTASGAPADADNFTLSAGSPAAAMTALVSDPRKLAAAAPPWPDGNAAMLALIGLRDAGFAESYDTQVTRVAGALSAARSGGTAADAARDAAVAARDAVSGVNLDDEAADILRFQQAYQAAARVISTARTLFDTLFELR